MKSVAEAAFNGYPTMDEVITGSFDTFKYPRNGFDSTGTQLILNANTDAFPNYTMVVTRNSTVCPERLDVHAQDPQSLDRTHGQFPARTAVQLVEQLQRGRDNGGVAQGRPGRQAVAAPGDGPHQEHLHARPELEHEQRRDAEDRQPGHDHLSVQGRQALDRKRQSRDVPTRRCKWHIAAVSSEAQPVRRGSGPVGGERHDGFQRTRMASRRAAQP